MLHVALQTIPIETGSQLSIPRVVVPVLRELVPARAYVGAEAARAKAAAAAEESSSALALMSPRH